VKRAPRRKPPQQRYKDPAGEVHPLLGTFPLVVMAFAGFLVLFTLTMAQFSSGGNPIARPTPSSPLLAKGHGGTPSATGTHNPRGSRAAVTLTATSRES
jgi:hypothetical protein